MTHADQSFGDSEDWDRGPGEFYVQSKSTVVNRRTEPTSVSRKENFHQFSDSIPHSERAEQMFFSNKQYKEPRSMGSTGTEIRVNVTPSYPAIEIPINRPNSVNRRWQNADYESGHEIKNSYGGNPLIVNPPTAHYHTYSGTMNSEYLQGSESYRASSRTNRGNFGRVISQVQIPPLTPSSAVPIRQVHNYESHHIEREGATSRRQSSFRNEPPYPMQRDLSMPAYRSRQLSRSKSRCHHCHNCHRHRSYNTSGRNARTPLPTNSAYAYPTMFAPSVPYCPNCQSGLNAMTPFPQNGIFPSVIAPPFQYVPAPMTPNFHSLPRRFSKRTSNAQPIGRWNQQSTEHFTPMHQSMMEKPPTLYQCVCCPNGIHRRQSTRVNPQFFGTTDSDGGFSDGNARNFTKYPPSGPLTLAKKILRNTAYQQSPGHNLYSEQYNTSDNETLRSKSKHKPSGYVITVQDAQQSPSPGIETGDGSQFAVRDSSNKFTFNKQEQSWSVERHGSVIRDDGFPNDYVDLIDTGTEYTAEEDKDDEFPLDKRVVVDFAKYAIDSSESPSQVAGNLKKSMDERFSPVWQVVAGTGAYGSNIASINGKLLHFKAYGWAFLIWKTA